MKNLISKYIKGAPLKSAKLTQEERLKRDWDRRHKSESHPIDGISPWKRVKRICEAYIGKQFDKAFSEYCSQVPVYQQKFFMQEFERKPWKTDYWTYYYVDKQGNIQKHIGTYFLKKKKVYFYSDDYKAEKRHKVTGAAYPQYHWMDKKFKEEDYEYVVVEGYFLEFKSAKDPEFIRLTTDQRKRKKAAARELAKEKAAKSYSFISNSEKELEKEKERNKVKIEAK